MKQGSEQQCPFKKVHIKQLGAAAMGGTFYTSDPTYSILHLTALQLLWHFCRENNQGIVRKAAGRLEDPCLLLNEQKEEARHYQGHQLKDCPCPKYCFSLLHLFVKAGQVSTNPPAPPVCPPCSGRAAAPATLLGPGSPHSKALQLVSRAKHWC